MSNKNKKKRKKRILAPRVQTLFCILSLLFIFGCCGYYGKRLIKYYKIYNPKTESGKVLENLSSKIIANAKIETKEDGLYEVNGHYIYKGVDVNNYILVSNMLFRIMKINSDKSLDLIFDDYVNKLEWNQELVDYKNSSIHTYLKQKVLPIVKDEYLTNSIFCSDLVTDLSKINCSEKVIDEKVHLPGLADYLNSLNNDQSYMNLNNEYLWLYNRSEKGVWHTSGSNISVSNSTSNYAIKPVITLKNSTPYFQGDGTRENPYRIEANKEIQVGTYLDIQDDVYIVYEVGENYYKIESNEVLPKTRIFSNLSNDYENSSLKKYLEDSYLNTLPYQNLLKEVSFGSSKAKIGILTRDDLKFNSSLKNYFLMDQKDKGVYLYNASLISSNIDTLRNVRITLGITKDLKIISGNGSIIAPFIVEEKNA